MGKSQRSVLLCCYQAKGSQASGSDRKPFCVKPGVLPGGGSPCAHGAPPTWQGDGGALAHPAVSSSPGISLPLLHWGRGGALCLSLHQRWGRSDLYHSLSLLITTGLRNSHWAVPWLCPRSRGFGEEEGKAVCSGHTEGTSAWTLLCLGVPGLRTRSGCSGSASCV